MANIIRLGGNATTRTLLWTNPNPTQDLPWVAGQFNIDPYDYILFEYKPIKTDTYEKVTIIKVIPNQTTFPNANSRIIVTKIHGIKGEI